MKFTLNSRYLDRIEKFNLTRDPKLQLVAQILATTVADNSSHQPHKHDQRSLGTTTADPNMRKVHPVLEELPFNAAGPGSTRLRCLCTACVGSNKSTKLGPHICYHTWVLYYSFCRIPQGLSRILSVVSSRVCRRRRPDRTIQLDWRESVPRYRIGPRLGRAGRPSR